MLYSGEWTQEVMMNGSLVLVRLLTTALRLSWLQNYQVAFDPKRERVGVRSAGISEEGTDDDVD